MSTYVTLPSNVSSREFPGNTNSDFSVRLDRPLKFKNGKFEVGLADIHFPTSHTIVPVGEMTLYRKSTFNGATTEWTRMMGVRKGRFTSIGELLQDVHRALVSFKLEKTVYVYYDEVRNKAFLKIDGSRTQILFSQDFGDIFGFEDGKKYGEGMNRSVRACDINAGFTALFVYADVMQPRLVGDVLAPLLRAVPLGRTKRRSTDAYDEFRNVQYSPVTTTNSDVVNVVIRRDNHEPVPFTNGKVILTVHYRPMNLWRLPLAMLLPYQPEDSVAFYEKYYGAQVGNGLSIPVYKGRTVMTGNGLGSMLSGLLKRALPAIKKGAMGIGKNVLSTSSEIMGDALDGKNIVQSAKSRFSKTGRNIIEEVVRG